jgi:hypothetical protein
MSGGDVILKGLRHEKEQVRDAVIAAAKHIFCFDLPGASILIPDFIREVNHIVCTELRHLYIYV